MGEALFSREETRVNFLEPTFNASDPAGLVLVLCSGRLI
jgi:hypothetical protein